MTDGRWGGDQWGDIEWGGGGSVSHSLAARAGVVAGAVASRIGVRHSLEALTLIESDAFGIGAGPGAIHPLAAGAHVVAVAAAKALRKQHPLTAGAVVLGTAGATILRKRHRVLASASIATSAFGVLSIGHSLLASARVASSAVSERLSFSHTLLAGTRVETVASAVYTIEIPEILEPSQVDPENPEIVTPGTVNLITNPIAAQGLPGWEAVGGAMISLDATFRWDGTRAIKVEPVSDGSGVAARTARPLGLAILDGAIVWGQAMLALNLSLPPVELPPEPDPEDPLPPPDPEAPVIDPFWVTGWVEVTYSDGSIDAGEEAPAFPIMGTGRDGDWDIFIASFQPDAGKVVVAARVLVVSAPVASIPDAFWVGGAQVEYDRWQLGPQPVRSTSTLVQTQLQGVA